MNLGQEQHVGTKAPPREITLENAVLPPEPGMVRVQVNIWKFWMKLNVCVSQKILDLILFWNDMYEIFCNFFIILVDSTKDFDIG